MATQINRNSLNIIRDSNSCRKSTLISIYSVLVTNRNWKTNTTSNVSYESIKRYTGCSRKTIDLALRELEDLNLISSEYRFGNTNLYKFPMEFEYKEVGEKIKKAKQKSSENIDNTTTNLKNDIKEMMKNGKQI